MEKVTQHEAMDAETVAGLLGVSTRQLSNYIKLKGLPSLGEGRNRSFAWREVMEWYVDYRISLDRYAGNDGNDSDEFEGGTSGKRAPEELKASERRKATAIADLKEIELERVRGTLVPMTDVSRVMADVAKGLQVEILGLPTRIAGQVLSHRTQPEVFKFLTTECTQLCTRLSQLKFETVLEHEDEPEDA